ncbi:IS200/IS605 family transposase [Micromonospora sp. SL1-18]|uniref:IS200/IS605 family transposase n=1 Tax=Micromonospora sp. SL1-18 TaxID=3399128 RepID=UPI003A4D6F23
MATDYPVRTGTHCDLLLHAHLVFVTKHRAPGIIDEHLHYLEQVMRQLCEQFECELVEFNGEDNHVHLLMNFPPKVALSKLVNSLNGVLPLPTPRLPQHPPPLLARHPTLWSGSYFTRHHRRPTPVGPAPVHRAAEPAELAHARALAALPHGPSPPLKGGALARILVAPSGPGLIVGHVRGRTG